jgi:uncharacterized membrane protein
MRSPIFEAKQELREIVIQILLRAVEKEAGIYLSDDEKERLAEQFNQALLGNLRI